MYSCIDIAGEDRIEFLQGQVTQDVILVDQEGSALAALCSPKGRVIVTARLMARDGSLAMVVPTASAMPVLQRLTMYRLRSRVDLSICTDFAAMAAFGATADPVLEAAGARPGDAWLDVAECGGLTAVRLTRGVIEIYAFGESPGINLGELDAMDELAWQRSRIDAGLVDIHTANAEKFTPHMLNLDRTGAISFDKGCYTGQEVVARTEHLGRVKRRVLAYRIDVQASIGDNLTHDGHDVGSIVNVCGDHCLAVVPVDLHGRTLGLGTGFAEPTALPYELD